MTDATVRLTRAQMRGAGPEVIAQRLLTVGIAAKATDDRALLVEPLVAAALLAWNVPASPGPVERYVDRVLKALAPDQRLALLGLYTAGAPPEALEEYIAQALPRTPAQGPTPTPEHAAPHGGQPEAPQGRRKRAPGGARRAP